MKDKTVFAVPAVAMVIAIGSFATIDEGMPPLESLMHAVIGIVGVAMAAASLGFAIKWNTPARPVPRAAASTAKSPAAAANSRDDGSLHTTYGTGLVGSDMSADMSGDGPGGIDMGGSSS